MIFVTLFQSATAQFNFKNKKGRISPWEIGLSGGITTFVTSVNPESGAPDKLINYWKRDINLGFGLSVTRNISPSLGVELGYLNTHLSGSWSNKFQVPAGYGTYPSPLTFNSKINEFDLLMVFNLNKIFHPGGDKDPWHLYAKTGIGVAHINDKQNFYPADNPYLKVSFVADGGVSVSMSEKVKLMVGSSFRLVNTDNLDGVHVVGIDPSGNIVGYTSILELYNYTYLRLSYSFGEMGSKNSRCIFMNKPAKRRIYRRH